MKDKIHTHINQGDLSGFIKDFDKWNESSFIGEKEKQKQLDSFLGHACSIKYTTNLFPKSPKMVKFLLEKGANPNAKIDNGYSGSNHALLKPHLLALSYHIYGSVGAIPKTPAKKILNLLKKSGVDVLGDDEGKEFLKAASDADPIHSGILKYCKKMVDEQLKLKPSQKPSSPAFKIKP